MNATDTPSPDFPEVAGLADRVHALQPLTKFERRILDRLMESPEQPVAYAATQLAMYGTQVHGHVTSNVTQVMVCRLRKKMAAAKQGWTIATEKQQGYRLAKTEQNAQLDAAEQTS
ncbi:helix-turn-helix domain-containing protein [Pseudoxanthomonas winnipegensis]|uniref:Helix-turn-helix domain-containing protein n=1 Tax=Pseudoxanthomonas winnipegensis TaxID=2480810 RepID=A0A4Q8M628_9GAMM|nr:helix-turn-helix domain-containing protein [Pseudoxanthomonas winnipegensis]TAA42503.1 helix-turn-helix domain-containing protein [Pseudoxanthomonas winnipegensis]